MYRQIRSASSSGPTARFHSSTIAATTPTSGSGTPIRLAILWVRVIAGKDRASNPAPAPVCRRFLRDGVGRGPGRRGLGLGLRFDLRSQLSGDELVVPHVGDRDLVAAEV